MDSRTAAGAAATALSTCSAVQSVCSVCSIQLSEDYVSVLSQVVSSTLSPSIVATVDCRCDVGAHQRRVASIVDLHIANSLRVCYSDVSRIDDDYFTVSTDVYHRVHRRASPCRVHSRASPCPHRVVSTDVLHRVHGRVSACPQTCFSVSTDVFQRVHRRASACPWTCFSVSTDVFNRVHTRASACRQTFFAVSTDVLCRVHRRASVILSVILSTVHGADFKLSRQALHRAQFS